MKDTKSVHLTPQSTVVSVSNISYTSLKFSRTPCLFPVLHDIPPVHKMPYASSRTSSALPYHLNQPSKCSFPEQQSVNCTHIILLKNLLQWLQTLSTFTTNVCSAQHYAHCNIFSSTLASTTAGCDAQSSSQHVHTVTSRIYADLQHPNTASFYQL